MSMRLDYAFYGLAIVLFALTAITFAFVPGTDGSIYAALTAVVGLISVGGGYFMRQKAASEATVSAPQAVVAESVQQTATPTVETSKTETPTAEVPSVNVVPAVEAPKVETPATAEIQPAAQISAPSAEVPVAEVAPQEVPAEAKSEFTRIRGISEKRAEQLKANGVNTVEELANASAEDLAAKLNVSPKIVKMWIGSAKKLAK